MMYLTEKCPTSILYSPYKPIFDLFTFPCGAKIRKRLVMAPMTTWSSNEDGSISNQEIDYYRLRARNVGMLITAAAHVLPVGQGFPRQLGAHCDDKIPSLKNLITTIQIQCASGVLQIFHAGRMRSPDILPMMQPVSASSIPAEHEGAVAPHEMTEYEILDTIEAFGEATHRAMKAGFNGVEIHGANGFLIQQFFSPHTNRRTDKWGGSLEKRMAFPLAVVDEVKEVIADYATWRFIVGYRLSPEEVWNQGITMDDTLQLVDALAKKKLDYLHVSTPDFWGGSLRDENDKKPRAVLIHERVGDRIPIIGVGSIRTPDDVVKVMDTGIPLVALGRELIMEPYWLEKLKEREEHKIRTTLSVTAREKDRDEFDIPDGLWQVIMERKGWLPVVE